MRLSWNLELGGGHFDQIDSGLEGGRQRNSASFSKALGRAVAFMDRGIVDDDELALQQDGDELGLDPEIEGDTTNDLLDNPWCG